jgi:transaldolase
LKLYIDSGNIEEIEKAAATGMVDGVTTNPTLISREHTSFEDLLLQIVAILKKYSSDFTVSGEVTAKKTKDIVEQGLKLAALDSHIIVKVPLTEEGIKAVRIFSQKGIRTNVTLVFSAAQALLAAKAGAYIVSPFLGRVDDMGEDDDVLMEEIRHIYDNYGFKTKILVASIRSPLQIKHAAYLGMDIATMPYSVFSKLFKHPLTDTGLAQFDADWEAYQRGN